jgi:hypothetical protein
MNVAELTVLAQDLIAAIDDVAKKENELKAAKKKADTLSQITIPSCMDELGMSEVTLDTGQRIIVKDEVYVSIPKKNKEKAFAWLIKNNFGGLIKSEVKTLYGAGERENAALLIKELNGRGLDAIFEEKIHPGTLKAFIKEQIKKGKRVPLKLFGAQPVTIAKIKEK